MNNEDKWLKQVKDKVENHQEVVPTMLWDKIAADLSLLSARPKLIPFYKKPQNWLLAAVVLVGVSCVALFLLQEDATIRNASQQKVYVAQDPYLNTVFENPQASSAFKTGQKQVLSAASTVPKADHFTRTLALNKNSSGSQEQAIELIREELSASDADVSIQVETAQEEKSDRKYDDLYAHLRSGVGSSSTWAENNPSRISLHTGGAGKLMGGGISSVETQVVYREVSLNSFTTSSALDASKSSQMFIRNGLPYIKDEVKINDYKHNQPISFGLSYSYALNKYLALESGLVYTYLSSDVTEIVTQDRYKQKFHYLGIPVKLYWSFFRHNKLSLYASGGGMVEVAVAGKVAGESKRPTRPQFSILAGGGAQYSFTRIFGFYIEPGIALYFNDGSHTETIRTEKPFNFNFNAGVRLTF